MIFQFTLFRLSRPLAFFIVIRVLGGCSFYAKIVNRVLSIESCMPQWGPTIFEVKFDLIFFRYISLNYSIVKDSNADLTVGN